MERCREKRPHVLFSFDYQMEHISAFFYLHDAVGHTNASKLVMAVSHEFVDLTEQSMVYVLAVRNPSTADSWMVNMVEEATIANWCEDLVHAAYQAAMLRHLGWLEKTTSMWGQPFAARCLRTSHQISLRIATDPTVHALAYPRVFQHVKNGDSIMLWRADLLKASSQLPKAWDPTYSSMVLREAPFVVSSMDDMHKLFTSRVHDTGEASVTIRARDAWIAVLVAAWMEQRVIDLEPALHAHMTSRTCGVIGNILCILSGNIEMPCMTPSQCI